MLSWCLSPWAPASGLTRTGVPAGLPALVLPVWSFLPLVKLISNRGQMFSSKGGLNCGQITPFDEFIGGVALYVFLIIPEHPMEKVSLRLMSGWKDRTSSSMELSPVRTASWHNVDPLAFNIFTSPSFTLAWSLF